MEAAFQDHSKQIIKKQQILLELSKMAFNETSEIFHRITETIASFFEIERVSIWFSDEAEMEIVCKDLFEKQKNTHKSGDRLQIKDYPSYFTALFDSRCIAAHDVFSDMRTREFNQNYHIPLDIKSMMDVPLRIEGKLKAVLCCEKTCKPKEWTLEEQDFASSLADIISLVIQTEERRKAVLQLQASEEKYRKLVDKAEESDRLKTSLMANMSHEFRTPMNAILGFSDLIAAESQDPDIVFFARKIHASGQRLMSTLKAILDLADIEGTKTKIKLQEINVQKCLHTTLQPFYKVASEKNLTLITEFKDHLTALADDNLLQMILFNLVDNAIKFTLTGGITIETDLKNVKDVPWVTIHIKDTGIGIPSEHFHTIFHEFRQLSEGYSRSYEGTGLGLTLAQRMAAMLEGHISVESEVGLGSIFTLWIPASIHHDPEPADEVVKIQVDIPDLTIRLFEPHELPLVLVVEDNDDNAEIIKLYLKGKFNTERASDALSAIRMASAQQFAGLLMDINLGPGIDGLKAAREIRKLDHYKQIPIIALTGYTMAGDQEKLLAGGCSHYLGKPFSQQGLLELMASVFFPQPNNL